MKKIQVILLGQFLLFAFLFGSLQTATIVEKESMEPLNATNKLAFWDIGSGSDIVGGRPPVGPGGSGPPIGTAAQNWKWFDEANFGNGGIFDVLDLGLLAKDAIGLAIGATNLDTALLLQYVAQAVGDYVLGLVLGPGGAVVGEYVALLIDVLLDYLLGYPLIDGTGILELGICISDAQCRCNTLLDEKQYQDQQLAFNNTVAAIFANPAIAEYVYDVPGGYDEFLLPFAGPSYFPEITDTDPLTSAFAAAVYSIAVSVDVEPDYVACVASLVYYAYFEYCNIQLLGILGYCE